ncbi:MAG TPA: hypothetical protein VN616_12655 [Puia sp.]|nr:hypothetical protein [Puia sp.]
MAADPKPLTHSRKKGLLALMIGFFILQAGFDLAHSVTAFPFVHYGMFSERFPNPESLPAFEILADDRPLRAAGFGIYRWDMIQQPLEAFDRWERTGDYAGDKARMKTIFPGLYALVSSHLDNPPGLATTFPGWYRKYLGRLLGRPVHRLRVEKLSYGYEPFGIVVLAKSPWINCD